MSNRRNFAIVNLPDPNLDTVITEHTLFAVPLRQIVAPGLLRQALGETVFGRLQAASGVSLTAPGELPPITCPTLPPPFTWDPCAPIPATSAPAYNLYFNEEMYPQGVIFPADLIPPSDPHPHPPLPADIGARLMTRFLGPAEVRFGMLAQYTQSWFVSGVRIGDLEAVQSLAPAESLELEVEANIKARVDRAGNVQRDDVASADLRAAEKEVRAAIDTAASSNGWSTSSGGNFTLGVHFLGLNAGGVESAADASAEISRTTTQTLNQLREAVSHASETVRTLSKVDVRGVTEVVVSERHLRKFSNPYQDRSLLLKIFSVIKRYLINTSRTALRLTLSVRFTGLRSDLGHPEQIADFVRINRKFLGEALLDDQIRTRLDDAIQGVLDDGHEGGGKRRIAIAKARAALDILFDDPLSTDETRVLGLVPEPTLNAEVQKVRNSFFHPADLPSVPFLTNSLGSGIQEAKAKNALDLYMILYVLYQRWLDGHDSPEFDDDAMIMCAAAAEAIDTWWTKVSDDDRSDAYKSSEGEDFAEIFRRIPGFRAFYEDFVLPLFPSVAAEGKEDALRQERIALGARLREHLTVFRAYYGQEYLRWLFRTVGPELVASDLRYWLLLGFAGIGMTVGESLLRGLVPANGLTLRGDSVVISLPFDVGVLDALYNAALADPVSGFAQSLVNLLTVIFDGTVPPQSVCNEVDLPTDGAYVEPVAGTCLLPDVPTLVVPPPPPEPVP
jgi:hypothetical protein